MAGSMFRSVDMAKCQMYLQKDTAYDFVKELGEMGIIQITDVSHNIIVYLCLIKIKL